MRIKPNIFSFATSELSQDAFICWLVSHIKDTDDKMLHECAKDFIVMLYNLDRNSGMIDRDSVRISMTEKYPQQQYLHMDVYFQVSLNDKVVSFIIEDKTYTSHHSDQLKKYRDGVLKDRGAGAKVVGVYFKTGYMFPHDEEAKTEGYQLLGYKQIHEFLQRYNTDNVIFESYKEFIKERYFDRYEQNKNKWESGDCSCFQYDFAQWEYMLKLRDKCNAAIPENDHHLYRGNNPDGSPWTQLRFIKMADLYGQDVSEYVFYRLDKLAKAKYYLSVRQYAKIKDKGNEIENLKLERRDIYRRIFQETINKGNLEFQDKFRNRGMNESEIAVLFFDKNTQNTPNNVLKEMESIHAAFVKRIKSDSELAIAKLKESKG